MTLRECGEQVKVAYGIPNVRLFGNPDTQVSLVGICPGAGKSTMPLALGFGCDVYITGDIDHHTGIDAVDQGMCIIDAGHYGCLLYTSGEVGKGRPGAEPDLGSKKRNPQPSDDRSAGHSGRLGGSLF